MTHHISSLSYATDKKVGAVLVKDDNIISFSYNGTPKGWDNETQTNYGITKPEVLHAEAQAIAKLARSPLSTNSATLYCNYSPCMDCAKLIAQVGIKRLVYDKEFKDTSGIYFLKQSNVYVNKEESTTRLINKEWLANTGLV